jgi:energy-coupling factor transport system ATP-binding protein
MARDVGLAFQNPNNQFFKYRVEDELLVGPKMLGREDDKWLQEICGLFNLKGLLERSPFRLSEGEKKRVALASILTMRPRLLVFDEPTVGQDGRFREALAGLLAALEDRGFTIVIVTHDLDFARATTDRWIVLHDGMLVADGSPRELVTDERLIRLDAVMSPGAETGAALSES